MKHNTLAGVKAVSAVFLALFSHVGMVQAAFADIGGHFAEDAIIRLEARCDLTGYILPDGKKVFEPDRSVTRAELVQMMVKCKVGAVPQANTMTFSDVTSGNWFYDAVAYARTQGWITGYADGTFSPLAAINRAEALAIILRSTFSDGVITGTVGNFRDVVSGSWYQRFVAFASNKTFVEGYKNAAGKATGYFGPANSITRGEAAVIVDHVLAYTPTVSAPVSGDVPAAGGGFIEAADSGAVRPLLLDNLSFIPERGNFTFPAPYNTAGVRLTNASDCGNQDCVAPVGYSYWANINQHSGSDTMLIFLGMNRQAGGQGPTLFSYNKTTGETKNLGPLFDPSSPFSYHNTEGWYFSATQPHALYVFDSTKLYRYDVITQTPETVFDITQYYNNDVIVWQLHSSNDDRLHSMTLRDKNSYADLGCAVYREDTDAFTFYAKKGDFDECQVDKSGEWLVIKENVDGVNGEDNRIINLTTGTERVLLDQDGAAGHSDMGYGSMVAADNWNTHANAFRVWDFTKDPLEGKLVYFSNDWSVQAPNHLSHGNAKAGVNIADQFACGSSANSVNLTRANEVICFKLDGSLEVVVVAPTITDLNASGGGSEYEKLPKGNLDITGQYFIWTANMGGNRLDAFLVKIPTGLLQ